MKSTVVIGSCVLAGALLWRHSLPQRVHAESADVIALIDQDDKDEEVIAEVRARHHPKRFRRISLTVKVVRKIKERFAIILNPTEADRMAVRRYAYDVLTKHMEDISDVDIARVAPIAAAYYWAKSDSEIEAAQIAKSASVLRSNRLFERYWLTTPWDAFNAWLRPEHE